MITVTGSLAFDHIMDFPGHFGEHIMPDKIHQINLSFLVNTLQKQRGGTAGNIAYNLALLKTSCAILGVAGSDFGQYQQFLKQAGVDTSFIKIVDDELTASAFIMTDLSDNQISAFYPGAIKYADSLSIKSVDPKPSFAVIAPDKVETMVKFFNECQNLNIPYLFDPGMQLPRLTDQQLVAGMERAEILIGNDYEMELMKKRVKDPSAFNKVKIVITTSGEKGSIIEQNHQTINILAARPHQVIDPTGAGDAFRGGFLAGYMKKLDLKVCGQMGATAACYAVEKYGTTNHEFSVEEFCQRYHQNFGEELKLQ